MKRKMIFLPDIYSKDVVNAINTYFDSGYEIDDILDATGDEKVLGKPIGSDEKNGKLTYAKRLGLDKARQTAKKLTDEALGILNEFNGDTTFLKELTEFLLQRDY